MDPTKLAAYHQARNDRFDAEQNRIERLKGQPITVSYSKEQRKAYTINTGQQLPPNTSRRNPEKIGGIKPNKKNIRKHGAEKLQFLADRDARWFELSKKTQPNVPIPTGVSGEQPSSTETGSLERSDIDNSHEGGTNKTTS
jgi:hypothetical protein